MAALYQFPSPQKLHDDMNVSDEPADRHRAAVEAAAGEWLATQAHVVGFWRELLVAANGDCGLVAALDAHARFLTDAARRAHTESAGPSIGMD